MENQSDAICDISDSGNSSKAQMMIKLVYNFVLSILSALMVFQLSHPVTQKSKNISKHVRSQIKAGH